MSFQKEGEEMAKITPELSYEIMQANAEGLSSHVIAASINKKYKINLAASTVNTHLKVLRNERKEIARGVAEKYVAESIPGDLEIMCAALMRLDAISRDKTIKVQYQIAANKAVVDAALNKLKISGVGMDEKEFTIKWDMGNDDLEPEALEEFTEEIEFEILEDE